MDAVKDGWDGPSLNSKLPPLRALIDHQGAMAFIDELIEVKEESARCHGSIRADNPFLIEERLPNWTLIEYMAQSVAAFAGYVRVSQGCDPRRGLLLGCRNLQLPAIPLHVGDRLEIEVNEIARFDDLGSFSAKIWRRGVEAASGTLSVYESLEWPERAMAIQEP